MCACIHVQYVNVNVYGCVYRFHVDHPRKKVLNLKGAFQRTFNRPLSRLLLLQFHAKAIVRLKQSLAGRLILHETAVATTYWVICWMSYGCVYVCMCVCLFVCVHACVSGWRQVFVLAHSCQVGLAAHVNSCLSGIQWRLCIIISRASRWGTLKSTGNPRCAVHAESLLDLHWSAWPWPGRGSASVPHFRYLSVSCR